MEIRYTIGSLTLIAAVWFRIRTIRPHWCGNLLFLGAALYCAILMIQDLAPTLAFIIISEAVTHFCAKGYDKSKASRGTADNPSVAKSGTNNSPQPSAVKLKPPAKNKPPVQDTPPVQLKHPVQDTPPVQLKHPVQNTPSVRLKRPVQDTPPVQLKHPVQNKPPVQPKLHVPQTLTTCVRCGKSLHGAKCTHCGFDHTSAPIYLLCLIAPQNLQIQIEPDDLS